MVLASELAVVEIDRAIRFGEARGRVPRAAADRMRDRLGATIASWGLIPLSRTVMSSARRSFPIEPVRALDAIHLASALEATPRFPDLRILSLDQRVRRNAEALGFAVVP